jgi:hypothetical protein
MITGWNGGWWYDLDLSFMLLIPEVHAASGDIFGSIQD